MPFRRKAVPSDRSAFPDPFSPNAPLPRPRAAISTRQDATSAVTSAPQSSSADPPTKKTAVDFATNGNNVDITLADNRGLTQSSSWIELLIHPQHVSDMSLTEAAFWVATKGGSLEFDIGDVETWKLAFDVLLKLIVNDDIDLWGRRFGSGLPEKIPGSALSGILIDYPYQENLSDFIFGDDPYLECYGIVDGEYWRIGFDDKLFSRWRQLEWSHLRIKAAEVAKINLGKHDGCKSKAGAGRKCQKWLVDEMNKSPEYRPKPKSEYRIEALAQFNGLSGRHFDTAWKQAIFETRANWSEPGRPSASKSQHRNPRSN